MRVRTGGEGPSQGQGIPPGARLSHQPFGRRWFREFPLPTPFFPFGDGFAPPPTPSPGPGRGVREVSDGTFSPKTAPRAPRRAQDDLQDASRWTKMAQDGSEDAPRDPKTAPRRLQETSELPQEAAKRPTSFKHSREINDVCFLAFSLLMAI